MHIYLRKKNEHGSETNSEASDVVNGPDCKGVSSDLRSKKFGPPNDTLAPYPAVKTLPKMKPTFIFPNYVFRCTFEN